MFLLYKVIVDWQPPQPVRFEGLLYPTKGAKYSVSASKWTERIPDEG